MDTYEPDFKAYDVIVSNYNGKDWSKPVQAAWSKPPSSALRKSVNVRTPWHSAQVP